MTDTTIELIPTPEWITALKDRFWKHTGEERTRQAIALREQGHSYQAIADELGYSHRMCAHWAVNNSVIAKEMALQTPGRYRLATEPGGAVGGDLENGTGDPGGPERRAA